MNTWKIGTWNVRTMLQPGKMIELAQESLKFGIDLLALQEIRWMGDGRIDKPDFTLLYSGAKDKSGKYGVGFLISSKIRKSLLNFEPMGSRLAKITLKGRFRNITIVSAYAPTEDKDEEKKMDFYNKLENLCLNIPNHHMPIILGDFNAKIGCEDFTRMIAGRHSLHKETSENGKILCEFARANNMVIKSTCFQHKDIHKGTWISPDGKVVNQIDHVLISARHATSINDIRTMRGPNCDSDHFLVRVILHERLNIASNNRAERPVKWQIENLKDPEKNKQFKEEISGKLEGHNKESTKTIEEKWEIIKETILQAAENTIGKVRPKRNHEWFDDECAAAIMNKNKARALMLQNDTRLVRERYKQARREANKIIIRKKREYLQNKVVQIEDFKCKNESKQFYRAVKYMTAGFKPRLYICKDNEGQIINDKNLILEHWAKHFQNLLGRGEPEEEMDTEVLPINQEHELQVEPPTYQEVVESIKYQKNNRAPGEDTITAEIFKNGGSSLWNAIHILICNIWETETMPMEWKIGIIHPIYKKGDKMKCESYRGIALLNVAYKIFSHILKNRLSGYAEKILNDQQCGFRPGRGTIDQIFTIRQAIEKCYGNRVDLYILFIDFKQAFDSIIWKELIKNLRKFEIPEKLIRLVKITLEESSSKVTIGNTLSLPFKITAGVRQGDALSAILFNLALHEAINELEVRGTIMYKSKQVFAYADDVALVARNERVLKEMFLKIEETGRRMGLHINENKTKYLIISPSAVTPRTRKLVIKNYTFEGVKDFIYLGVNINSENKISEEINHRIMLGNRAFYANIKLLKSQILSKKTKVTLYKTLIRPIITYAAETWVLTNRDAEYLRRFERKVMRRIYGPVHDGEYWRRRTNKEIQDLIQEEDVIRHIKSRRLEWLGHVHRMTDERLPKRTFLEKMACNRSRGRPRKTWYQELQEDLKILKVTNWKMKAECRKDWRIIVEEAKTHHGL